MSSEPTAEGRARCTLCPAGCELSVVNPVAGVWRVAYPRTEGAGLCPRGSILGELLGHRRRIRSAGRRREGRLSPLPLEEALREVAEAGKAALTIFLDGALPCEQLAAAAAWCGAWPAAKLCIVIEPADEEVLLGVEASGATYLADGELADCDGFLVVGDAFAANPCCARGLLDRRIAKPKTPVVAIDAACGTAVKFATHAVDTPPGRELDVLLGVAAGAGSDAKPPADAPPAARAAGEALAACQRLGVLIAAEYGRTTQWRQIGYVAGHLAAARGGGVAVQTVGANALGAVRLARKLDAVPFARAAKSDPATWVAVGCDVVGMLGAAPPRVLAAAAPLPNRTTECASIVLPLALAAEYAGTILFGGRRCVNVAPLLPPPAGVPTAAELVERLASAAGVPRPPMPPVPDAAERLHADPPAASPAASECPSPALLLGRQPMHAGCGDLTAHGSWTRGMQPVPEMRISPADAKAAGLKNMAPATVRADGRSLEVRVQVADELPPGRFVVPEGLPEARALNPAATADGGAGMLAAPVAAAINR